MATPNNHPARTQFIRRTEIMAYRANVMVKESSGWPQIATVGHSTARVRRHAAFAARTGTTFPR